MTEIVVGVLGGVVGGIVVACVLLLAIHRRAAQAVDRHWADRAGSLSHRLWNTYVAIACGNPVPPAALRSLHDEVFLAAGSGELPLGSEEALVAMALILRRAEKRAAEFRRVHIGGYPHQFVDLTDEMLQRFGCAQLGSERGRSGLERRVGRGLAGVITARLAATGKSRC